MNLVEGRNLGWRCVTSGSEGICAGTFVICRYDIYLNDLDVNIDGLTCKFADTIKIAGVADCEEG